MDSADQDLESPAIPHWYSPSSGSLTLTEAEDARVIDEDGNAYLDFSSQLVCVNAGYGNETILEKMRNQMDQVTYIGSHHNNNTRTQLATKLVDIFPDPISDIYFAVSGSEANETAIQFARSYQDAQKILTRWRSYHGWTYGTGGVSGDPTTRKFEEHAATTGSVKFMPPLSNGTPLTAETPEELADQAIEHLEFTIQNEDPDSIAAILTEPIGGASGAYTAPPGYFKRVRELCDTYDILLIADEVITGFGRTGSWFAMQDEGVVPDMTVFAKGVTSSYAPLAGVAVSDEINRYLRSEGTSIGQTFAGHPVACAAGLGAIEAYENGLIDNVNENESVLSEQLNSLQKAHDVIGEVRGRGFLWAIEFADPETGDPFVHPWIEDGENPVKDVLAAAQQEGLLAVSGRPSTQIILGPPYCTTKDDIEKAIDILDSAITSTFE